MRDCPQCGAPVDGVVCDQCGHGGTARSGEQRRVVRCYGRDMNVIICCEPGCSEIGSISHHAGAGPWYCSKHAREHVPQQTAADRAAGVRIFAQLKAQLKQRSPKEKTPPCDGVGAGAANDE